MLLPMKNIAAAFLLLATAASAQNINQAPAMTYERLMAMEMRVIKEDITDHPYRVIAEIEADATQITRFSKRPTNRKLAEELWDEALKVGADAVVNARFGDVETTGIAWGQRRAWGQAVQFLTPAEIAEWRAQKSR